MFEPVNTNVKLRDRVVKEIVHKIDAGDLTVGQRLPPEREMAVQFNVSRTTIRDALRTLAALGILSIEHGRGIFVRARDGTPLAQVLSPLMLQDQTISDLFDVRRSLETAAAGWAAVRATDAERQELIRIVTSIREEINRTGEAAMDMIVVADEEFHRTVLSAGHNPVASRIMLNLLDVLGEARRHSLSIAGRAMKSVMEHEVVAKAIASGNREAAERAMRDHLSSVEEEILSNLKTKTDHDPRG